MSDTYASHQGAIMSVHFTCLVCGEKLRAPNRLAGKHTGCPHCHEVVRVPRRPAPQASAIPVVEEDFSFRNFWHEAFASSTGLGLAALLLGVLSIEVHTVPLLRVLALALSAGGLVVAVKGLVHDQRQRSGGGHRPGPRHVNMIQLIHDEGLTVQGLGCVVCFLALLVALWPMFR